MFEDALIESSGRIITRSRYYTLFGALFNGCLLAGLILVPLLRPEALPRNLLSSVLLAPTPPPPPPPPAITPRVMHEAPHISQLSEFSAPSRIPKLTLTGRDTEQPPSTGTGMEQMAGDSGPAGSPLGGLIPGTGAAPFVRPPTPQRVSISQGVMAGSILVKPQPLYPAIARAARIEGTVVLSATISKAGIIEHLSVVSGPQMLAPAAIEAVRQWRYRPYLLNGEPVEVLTQINVNFTLGG